MLIDFIIFAAGVGILVFGGEGLVRGATGLAKSFGVPALIIGLTVVSFGTSAPEVAVTLTSAFKGAADIGVGNVIGSNIANTFLILGLGGCIVAIAIDPKLTRRDIPIMIGFSILAAVFCFDEEVTRLEGGLLFGALLAYILYSIQTSRKARKEHRETQVRKKEAGEPEEEELEGDHVFRTLEFYLGVLGIIGLLITMWGEKGEFQKDWMIIGGTIGLVILSLPSGRPGAVRNFLFIVVGIGLLVTGAGKMVLGAVNIAEALEVPQHIIGLTIVSIGTSMPEVAVTVIAAMKGEADIATGNVVGSNIFNIGAVLGPAALITPLGVNPDFIRFDLWIVLGSAALLLAVAIVSKKVNRPWAGAFLVAYFSYLGYLVSQAM
jgi:cation:H+ antiporter